MKGVKKYINLVFDLKLVKMVLTLMMRMMMVQDMYRLPIDIKFISNKNYGKQLNIQEDLEDPFHHVDPQIP
jgi:hypothetical protein